MNLLSQIENKALAPSLQLLTATQFFGKLLQLLIASALAVGGIIFLFIFLTGGIDWINSAGDKQKLETARAKLLNGIIGLLILFSTFAIIKFLESIFGFSILSPKVFTLYE